MMNGIFSFLSPRTCSRVVVVMWLFFVLFFSGLMAYVYAVANNSFGLFGGLPGLEKLANPQSERASIIYSADNQVLGKYFKENREDVRFEDISPNLIKALYATEDIRFDQHSGVDLKGTFAIFWYVMRMDKRGSSTLTQQLAKNLFETRSELYKGTFSDVPLLGKMIVKTKEWITAINLERSYTKKEILTMYLNTVDFGSNAFGIKVAAKTFFGVQVSELSATQAAVLVGVLKAPTLYSPILNPQRSLNRRNTVLAQMFKYKYLTESDYRSFISQPIVLNYSVEKHFEGYATYFRAELKKDLMVICRENKLDLYTDGLKIYTTIDSRVQRYAEAAVEKHMQVMQKKFFSYWKKRNPWVDEQGKEIKNFIVNAAKKTTQYKIYLEATGSEDSAMAMLKRPVRTQVFSWKARNYTIDTLMSPIDSIKYMKKFLHAGLMAMDPATGHIKAWVGGINYKFFQYDHVRQGKRQPGSSFKPFLYCAAMDNGYTPCYEMVDAPVTFYIESTGQSWTPKNSDGAYTGERMTLRKAMALSINSVAAQLIQKLGPNTLVDYAKRLGIQSPLDPVPALALGASDVSVYEMVGAYSVFANKGVWTKPYYITRIADKNDNLIKQFNVETKEVINQETAYLMIHMLRGATQERNGTAIGLHRLGKTLYANEVGAKTGTTSNYSDGWFMGVTHNLVTAVWTGGEDRSIHFHSMSMGQGSKMAMPIWSYFMDMVYQDKSTGIKKGYFKKPKGFAVELDCKALAARQDSTAQDSTTYTPSKADDFKDE